jgi:hypothetical protein
MASYSTSLPSISDITQAQGIRNTTIELQTLNTNFAIAMKWARNHILHITRHHSVRNETKYDTKNNYWRPTSKRIIQHI